MAKPFRCPSTKRSSRCRHEPPAVCSGADAVKAFRRIGYEVDHQTGSHIILRHPSQRRLTVPNHRELAKGTLRALVREAGLTKEQFAELLH